MTSNSVGNDHRNDTDGGRFRVRGIHVLSWLVVAMGLFVVSVAVGQNSAAVDAAPSDGVLFGAYAQPRGNESQIGAVQSLEATLGDTLPIVRSFSRWDSNLDNRFNNWVVDGDRRLMVSIKPKRRNGSEIRWSRIASAQPGSTIHNEIVRLARDAKQLDGEVWLTFHHEPEAKDRQTFGTNTDYKNAWRTVHRIFEEQGADVKWVWTMTSWSFEVDTADRRSAGKWYPGDNYVDFLGADPYNWNQCRGNTRERWTSLERIITPFIEFAEQHPTKQLVLPEFGSDEGTRGQKADWLDEVATFMKRPENASRFAAVIYFHDEHEESAACTWWLDSSGPTRAAAQRIAADPFFDRNSEGAPAPEPSPEPTPPPAPAPTPTPPPAPAPPAGEIPPIGGCAIDTIDGSDRVTWTPQGDGFKYNVRRNDRWLAKTNHDTWYWNRGVTSGSYVVIGRDGDAKTTLTCRRR